MARNSDSNDEVFRAGTAFPTGQLMGALEAALRHEDPEVRRRAEQRALAWEAVISGIASGTLEIGSRTPVEDTPAWVTLEVVHGGFATGRYVAEGQLEHWEEELLAHLPTDFNSDAGARQRLNSWHLTDQGLEQLRERLTDRTYSVEVPEEGALLVVAWLMGNGFEGDALDLVAVLYPLMDRLRFYPRPVDRPIVGGAVVRVRTAGEVTEQLQRIRVPGQVAAMGDAITVWNPLVDRLLELWLSTYVEGWPCQQWPTTWSADREAWLTDFNAAASAHPASRHLRTRSTLSIMAKALERCPKDSSDLSPRDVGRLRKAIDAKVARWGAPGSDVHAGLRQQQDVWASNPTHRDIATVIAERLAAYPRATGVPDLEPIVDSVELDGAVVDVPPSLIRKTQRVLEAPVEELVDRGVIGSAEVLAQVLPQISSQVAASGIDDRELQPLYAQLYQAFRSRRSLLLLNLEHQVRIEELPWVAALDRFRVPTQTTQRSAHQTLTQTTMLAITSFPQTILPNPLVTELSALARQADVNIPFVEEVAADIFMGTFTEKWREAARIASTMLEGSLYARYYDLPDASRWEPKRAAERGLLRQTRTRWGKQTAEDFAGLCEKRSREAGAGDGSFVARNGTVLEQSQILTTHNLAPLVAQLGLHDQLATSAPVLASDVFTWIVRQQSAPRPDWRSNLQAIKNSAYAWRQAIFLLSLTDEATQRQVIASWRDQWSSAPTAWRDRFEPALIGLERISDGSRFDESGMTGTGRRLLGWSVGPHWLAPREP